MEEQRKKVAEMQEKLARTTDGLGMPIDPGIFELVVMLNVLGFETSQSCEGHLDHGRAAPWVRCRVPEAETWIDQSVQARKEANEQLKARGDQATDEERYQAYAPTHAFREQAESAMAVVEERLINALADFSTHQPSSVYHRRLIVYTQIPGTYTLESQGACLQVAQPPEQQAQRLHLYQEEMQAFAAFLKERYVGVSTLPTQNEDQDLPEEKPPSGASEPPR